VISASGVKSSDDDIVAVVVIKAG